MLVPAPLALHGGSLAPAAGVLAGETSIGETPQSPEVENTALAVRRDDLNVLVGQSVTIAGELFHSPGVAGHRSPGLAGGTVLLQVREEDRWRTLAGTRTGLRGRYRLRYRLWQTGSELMRMRFLGSGRERGSHRELGVVNVYREVLASWYGGGGGMACGGTLTSSTLGVANKTLPCGTIVTLRYGGRTVRVPVVDRGPYVEGREFDLTEATKEALGFEGVGEVWAT